MTVQGELIRIGRHEVRITHPEKLLFPDDGVTKQDLIDYYRSIASWILPHLRGRPLVLERYPDGINEPGFFQKDTPSYYPGWIKMVTVKKVGGSVRHVVCDDAPTLVYLANQACVTPHIWLSRTDKLDHPDQMVLDLDPSGDSFEAVKATAQSLKELLDQLGLPAYLKTTGSRGLHVAVPARGLGAKRRVRHAVGVAWRTRLSPQGFICQALTRRTEASSPLRHVPGRSNQDGRSHPPWTALPSVEGPHQDTGTCTDLGACRAKLRSRKAGPSSTIPNATQEAPAHQASTTSPARGIMASATARITDRTPLRA